MRCTPILLILMLSACGPQPTEDQADMLAADPVRLKALRAQCATDQQTVGETTCQMAAEAFRRRFFAGQTGPDEYHTLIELPPIPPSFDEPVGEEMP
ncbi:TPA: hypothetical protein ACPHSP_005873 [Pseudomonas aeruginosa]